MQPTIADKNNNPGNLRDPRTGNFQVFSTPQEGYAALLNDLQAKIAPGGNLSSNSTLYDFAKIYAPSSDNNNPAQYTVNLANILGVRPDTQLGQLQPHIGDFAQAIARNEGFTAAKGFSTKLPISNDQSGSIPFGPGIANADVNGQQPQQSPSVGGFVQNVASSAGNLLGGLGQAVMHPIDTLSNAAGMVAGGFEKLGGIQNEDTQKFDALTGYLKQRYGGDSLSEVVNHIGSTAYNDPVGMALDLSTLVDGVGAAVGAIGKTAKIAELSKAADLLKNASETINPIAQGTKVVGKAASLGTDVAKFGTAKIIGFPKAEDVSTIINEWDKLSPEQRAGMSRGSLAEDFGQSLDQLDQARLQGGRMFGRVIAANEGKIIPVPENWIADVLQHGTTAPLEDGSRVIPFGLKLEPVFPKEEPGVIQMGETNPIGYKVVSDTTSKIHDAKDIAAIQNFVDKWAGKTELTPEEFINMRSQLSDMSHFGREIGKNSGADRVGMALRADANKVMRPAITGLKETDQANTPIINLSNRARKDFLQKNPNGGYEFKDGAINKLANAAGTGKDQLLSRIEQIAPGFTKKIQLLKTVESIESAFNIKVGTYAKDILAAGSLLHGNIPGVIASIIAHPAIAIPLLRGLGWTKTQITPILQFLRKYINTSTLKYPVQAGILAGASSQGNQPQNQSTPQVSSQGGQIPGSQAQLQ